MQKSVPITPSCLNLIESVISQLIPKLQANGSLLQLKQLAFGYYSADAKELFQVQIIVTRDKDLFLEHLLIEELEAFKHK